MEFIFVSGRRCVGRNIASVVEKARMIKGAKIVSFRVGAGRIFASFREDEACRRTLPLFDGAAVFEGKLHTTCDSMPSPEMPIHARGSFCQIRSERSSLYVERDAYGMYPIWSLAQDGLRIVSNNVHLIAAVSQRILGSSLKKNADHLANILGVGHGLFGSSLYENVELLDVGFRIKLSPKSLEKERIFSPPPPDKPYSALIRHAVAEISENIRAIAASPHTQKICELTGGLDSRLMLAAILGNQLRDVFGYYTSGKLTPDGQVASHLRRRYGLQRVLIHSSPTDIVSCLTSDLHYGYGAVPLLEFGHFQPERLRLTGLMGEYFRQPLGTNLDVTKSLAGTISLLAPKQRERIIERLRADVFRRRQHFDTDGGAVLDYYVNVKNPSLSGVINRCHNDVQLKPMPLYSFAGHQAAQLLNDQDRAGGKVMHDIMYDLYPNLVSDPFDEPRWLFDGAPVARELKQSVSEDKVLKCSAPIIAEFASPSKEDTAWMAAQRASGKNWQFIHLETGMKALKSFDRNLLAEIIDPTVLDEFQGTNVERLNRMRVRQVYQLLRIVGALSPSVAHPQRHVLVSEPNHCT